MPNPNPYFPAVEERSFPVPPIVKEKPEEYPNPYPVPPTVTQGEALSFIGSQIPVFGDVKSGIETITGKDIPTGRKLNTLERIGTGVGALPFIPPMVGIFGKKPRLNIPPTGQHLELFSKEYPQISGVAVKQADKVYTTGGTTHAEVMLKNKLNPEMVIPGFMTKSGQFVEQYGNNPYLTGGK